MENNIRLSKLIVKDLFNTFTHEISLKHQEGITLLLGQNGLGKTMVLKIIESILEGDFIFLETIEFSTIRMEFLNGVIWEVEQESNDTEGNFSESHSLFLRNVNGNNKNLNRINISKINGNIDKIARLIRRHAPEPLRQIDDDEWINMRTQSKYSTKKLIHKYKNYIPKQSLTDVSLYPSWVSDILSNQGTSLIETQRLLILSKDDEYMSHRRNYVNYINTVEEYSRQLSSEIKLQLADSMEFAAKLDRTYPNRLIDRLKNLSSISQDELNTQLDELEKKRSWLKKVGLLDLKEESELKDIQDQDNAIKEVLLVYIEDSQEKLKAYDDFAKKIDLFLTIINEKFLMKEISISKEKGFVFKSTKTGLEIPVEYLSSGEQHLLVLYYKLLFKLKKNTLLLMDEPEISLHISWQKKIISDLKGILKLNQMDIIIATHSPSVIGNNWDLTVELEA